ncbi:unnamed protein product, partial [Acidithrix sp. C25]
VNSYKRESAFDETSEALDGSGVPLKRTRTLGTLALGGLILSACGPTFGAFRGATTQGQSMFHLYQGFFYTAIAVGAITFSGLLYVVLRFRRRTDTIPHQRHSNVPIEVIYTVIPTLIVIALFVFTVRSENKITAVSSTPNVSVKVTAFQWGWRFTYANGVSIVSQGANYPQLVLPETETTKITLVSQDVVHGFYIPAFNFSRYALPGVTNYFDFNPTTTGTFVGRCSQLCGLYHGEMLFSVRVVTPAQFQSWLTQQKAATA